MHFCGEGEKDRFPGQRAAHIGPILFLKALCPRLKFSQLVGANQFVATICDASDASANMDKFRSGRFNQITF